jgi:hypothetical protein
MVHFWAVIVVAAIGLIAMVCEWWIVLRRRKPPDKPNGQTWPL